MPDVGRGPRRRVKKGVYGIGTDGVGAFSSNTSIRATLFNGCTLRCMGRLRRGGLVAAARRTASTTPAEGLPRALYTRNFLVGERREGEGIWQGEKEKEELDFFIFSRLLVGYTTSTVSKLYAMSICCHRRTTIPTTLPQSSTYNCCATIVAGLVQPASLVQLASLVL